MSKYILKNNDDNLNTHYGPDDETDDNLTLEGGNYFSSISPYSPLISLNRTYGGPILRPISPSISITSPFSPSTIPRINMRPSSPLNTASYMLSPVSSYQPTSPIIPIMQTVPSVPTTFIPESNTILSPIAPSVLYSQGPFRASIPGRRISLSSELSPLTPTIYPGINRARNIIDFFNNTKSNYDDTTYNYKPVTLNRLNRDDDLTQKNHSGAGIILFEKSFNNGKKNEPTVLLFNSNGFYQDLGGSVELSGLNIRTDILQETAKREAFEESASYLEIKTNLNKIINNKQTYVDIPVNSPKYRCYAIGLNELTFIPGSFVGNLDKLKNTMNTPSTFLEMSEVRRFYLSDIKNCIASTTGINSRCNTVDGEMCTIRSRTVSILQEMLKKNGTSIVENVLANTNITQEYTNVYGMKKLIIF
jgi:hypothetical protein